MEKAVSEQAFMFIKNLVKTQPFLLPGRQTYRIVTIVAPKPYSRNDAS